MKLLVKYPTRSRPDLFLKNIADYTRLSANKDITYLVSYDIDDKLMTKKVIERAKKINKNIIFCCGVSKSKIHACNRDLEVVKEWDILLLISDDMFVKKFGWDAEIINQMKINYPDTDGCLWFHDGSKQKVISTLSCIGRRYFDKFGYIYHPDYKSFFCDNEYTEVAKLSNKIKFIDNVIIKHEHPHWGGEVKNDLLYKENSKHWKHDQDLYSQRKPKGFK
jgi:hypothetical protein